ncbi:KilA-N domain-containing protein [Nostoc sp.]
MNLVTHDWNGSAIAQLSEATKISKYDVPAGYVNATQMCQACGKLWGHYAELDGTKLYWEALSLDIGITISGLVLSIKGGNNKQVQGTWVHPEIAIDLAQWVSVEFRIWANRTLKKVISEQIAQTAIAPAEIPSLIAPSSPPNPTAKEISELFDLTLGGAGLDPKLIAGVKLNAIASYNPALAEAAEIAKSALAVPVEAELLTATKLGQMLSERSNQSWTARQINQLLIEQGFQEKNPEGDPDYLPTTKGEKFCKMILNTAKGHGKTIQSLRWFKEVLEALELNDH